MSDAPYIVNEEWRQDLAAFNAIIRDTCNQLLDEYRRFGTEIDHETLALAESALRVGFEQLDRAVSQRQRRPDYGPTAEPRRFPRF